MRVQILVERVVFLIWTIERRCISTDDGQTRVIGDETGAYDSRRDRRPLSEASFCISGKQKADTMLMDAGVTGPYELRWFEKIRMRHCDGSGVGSTDFGEAADCDVVLVKSLSK